MMGGPMDYTPGFFRMPLNQFIPERKTRVRTTLPTIGDVRNDVQPLANGGRFTRKFESHPDALQFIKDVPVDWDDTKI